MRRLAPTLVAAGAALLTSLAVAPAFAGTHPTPTPSYPTATPTYTVTPTPAPTVTPQPLRFRPEEFDIILANDLGGTSVNAVNAEGPVNIRAGTDTQVTPFLDLFNTPGSDVRVLHAPLPAPDVDLRTCTVRFTLTDAPWRFAGGVGLFARARGFGVFDLNAEFSFSKFRGRCALAGLSGGSIGSMISSAPAATSGDNTGEAGANTAIAAYCHRHHIPVPVLLASDVFVQGTGFAAVTRPIYSAPTAAPTHF